ncbi:hypothetical protein IMSAGC021_01720 [Muribaculaceae bacterium]|nr:hypothetical protein IMSAGC021_01720 [Muribaculaceae bacterium]
MERGRSDAHHEDSGKNARQSRTEGKHQNAGGSAAYPRRQTPHKRAPVKGIAHHRLKNRSRKLIDERDQTDLAETQTQVFLQHRVDSRYHRLQQIVETVGRAQRKQHMKSRHLHEPVKFLQK